MRTDLGRPGALMPEEILEGAEVGATFQTMGREAAPEGMAMVYFLTPAVAPAFFTPPGGVRQVEEGGYQDLSPRRTPKVGLHHGD